MAGSVMAPVDATLAEAEPEIDPNRAEEMHTDTLAAPPFNLPAAGGSEIHEPLPGLTGIEHGAPKITNTATMFH